MLRSSQTILTSDGMEMKCVHKGEALQIDGVNDSHTTRHFSSYGYGLCKIMPAELLLLPSVRSDLSRLDERVHERYPALHPAKSML